MSSSTPRRDVIRLPPLRPDVDTTSPTLPVWSRAQAAKPQPRPPRGGLALAGRRNIGGDTAIARARTLGRLEAKAVQLSPPATPRTPRTPGSGRRLVPLPPSAAELVPPQQPAASSPTSDRVPRTRPGPRTRARSKNNLSPIKREQLRTSSGTASPLTSPASSNASLEAEPRSPLPIGAPPLPPPSLAERGGSKTGGSIRARRRTKAAGGASSQQLAAPAPPLPPAMPKLPAAVLPTLPPPSEHVQTHELAAMFWASVQGALAPAAMDEQWSAVRRLVTAC